MLRPSRPLDAVALGFACALGLLAWSQWAASQKFAQNAVVATARVVELRTAPRILTEPTEDVFATVEFDAKDGERHRAELPTPIDELGVGDVEVGRDLTISYDPASPRSARHGRGQGREGALVLALLAAGALFAPAILRRSSLAAMAGGGG